MLHAIQQVTDEEIAELKTALQKVIELGLQGEICGYWLWVSGDTKPHKDILKAEGFRWAPKKELWFFRPSGKRSFSRGNWDMDRIRLSHGSQRV